MKNFRIILKIIFKNWTSLIYFEIAYKTFGFTIVFSFIQHLLSLLPASAGLGYLSQENIGELIKSPAAVFICLTVLFLTALYTAYEIIAFMVLCEYGWHDKKISLFQMCGQAASKTVQLIKPSKIGVTVMLPVLMFSVFSPISGYLKNIRIPGFILKFLGDNPVLFGIFIGLLLLFHILLLLYLFGVPALLFEGISFRESWKESLKLLRRRKIKIAAEVIGLTFCFIILFLALSSAFILFAGFYIKLAYAGGNGRYVFRLNLVGWLRVIQIVGSILTSAFLCGAIMVFYHQCRGESRQMPFLGAEKKGGAFRRVLFRLCNMILLVYLLFIYSETEIDGGLLPYDFGSPMIIAHRAGAAFVPENTIAALHSAIEDGADAAEIDIQQLGDGTLIVMHDTNFKRTAGVNLNVWDADYEMLQELNADSGREAVPTLEEFFREARGKIRLMLELKASGHENGIESGVLQMVRRYNMENQCMIASMDLNILKRVREMDSEVETVYISAILITGKDNLNAVDGYSVETTSLTQEMAALAHFQGKKIYGWTANSGHAIKKILRCGADGIITDNVLYAEFFMKEYGNNLLAEDIVSLFYGEESWQELKADG